MKLTILYVFHEAYSSGGATYSGMNMVKSLDRTRFLPIAMVPGEGDIKCQLEAIGVKCIVAPVDFWFRTNEHTSFLRHQVHRYRRFKAKLKGLIYDCLIVKRELKGQQIDIVHSNTTAIMTGFVLSKFLRCKHVWHLREFIDKDFHERPYIGFWLLRKCINAADATVSITRAVRQHWVCPQTPHAYQIFNAVKSVKSLLPLISPKERFFLFCANWVSGYKGARWAMDAFCRSRLFEEDYKLVFIGNCAPEYKEELLVQARLVNAEDNIEFVGYCKQPTPYFQKATAFLMCSDNEAMGRTTIEAFWNGCPVLGRNTGGTPELVKDGETGYLFNTVEELASLMGKIAKKDNSQIIENARQFALQNFTEEEYGKKIEEIYQAVMNKL